MPHNINQLIMNKMPIKYNPLVNNVLQLGQRTGHCPAGIFKNIISNVTKMRRQDTDLSPVPQKLNGKMKERRMRYE